MDVIEFTPAYRRFTPVSTQLLMRITAALGVIRGARVLPALADQLRTSARAGTVHFSNLIEGNELPIVDAERATRGELAPDSRAKIELINYVQALAALDRSLSAGTLTVDEAVLLELHGIVVKGLGRDGDPHFQARHEGAWRDGRAVVLDRLTGRVMHEGPPPEEVPARMCGLFAWLERKRADEEQPVFVLAGVLHHAITDIHPFVDGNGRIARLAAVALLMSAGVLPERMFSFERYYADDRPAYYEALRSVRRRTLNMEVWLEYFLRGLAEEYERVAGTVSDLAALLPGGDYAALRLSASQQWALSRLRLEGRKEFTRVDYEHAAGIARTSAGGDLQTLVQHGILTVRGHGPATGYRFASPHVGARPNAAIGRPRRWTDLAIETALRDFLADRDDWPSPRQFRAAGHGALYSAVSKAGGVGRWRQIVGR